MEQYGTFCKIRVVKLTKAPVYVKEILARKNTLTGPEVLYTVYKTVLARQ